MEHFSENFNTVFLQNKILRTEVYKSNPDNDFHWKYKTICDRYLITYVVCATLLMCDVSLNNSFVLNNVIVPSVVITIGLLLIFAVVVAAVIAPVVLFAWINAEI